MLAGISNTYFLRNATTINSDRLQSRCQHMNAKIDPTISAAVHNTSKENRTLFTPHLSFFIHGSRPSRFVPSCMRTEHISVIVRLLATKKNDDEERQMLITSLIYYYSTIFRASDADITFQPLYSIIVFKNLNDSNIPFNSNSSFKYILFNMLPYFSFQCCYYS